LTERGDGELIEREAEGFEQAERELIEAAEHGEADQESRPDGP
jgi:hypothetical protein